MTKSPHKLVLRKDTLRTLNSIDLSRVVGGDGTEGPLLKPTNPECALVQNTVTLSK
jgi:hypothetical protein